MALRLRDRVDRKLSKPTCVLCDVEYPSEAELNTHFWQHADTTFELQCMLCTATFKDKDDLLAHITAHNGTEEERNAVKGQVFTLSEF